MLPPRIPKSPKRSSRWRSQAHTNFVKSRACSRCGRTDGIESAHIRIGSGAGMGQKPDDWRCVSLCAVCHDLQHDVGERTFWQARDHEALIAEFIKASPKRAEIEKVMRERKQESGE